MYLYFEIKRLPRHPRLSPPQHEIDLPLSPFFLYRAFLPKQWNLIYVSELILLRIRRYGYVDVTCCNTSLILHGIFSTIEKDTTKSRGLRTVRVPEPTSRLQSNREETNANGGTKWWQISKTQKKSYKIGVRRNQKIPSGKVIAWCVDLNEKIKNSLSWECEYSYKVWRLYQKSHNFLAKSPDYDAYNLIYRVSQG